MDPLPHNRAQKALVRLRSRISIIVAEETFDLLSHFYPKPMVDAWAKALDDAIAPVLNAELDRVRDKE